MNFGHRKIWKTKCIRQTQKNNTKTKHNENSVRKNENNTQKTRFCPGKSHWNVKNGGGNETVKASFFTASKTIQYQRLMGA